MSKDVGGEIPSGFPTKSPHSTGFQSSTFISPDTDENLVSAEQGALGVINPDVQGPSK